MSPYGYESRIKVNYAEAHIFTHENMAIRELYESPADNQILIVDHLRDRNGVATSVSPISYRTPLASRSVTGGDIAFWVTRYFSAS